MVGMSLPVLTSSAGLPLRSAGWHGRDLLAAAFLFAATAAVVLWQNAHVAVLWDLSYVLDTASRIALGQLPYRDFPLAHAPLTFLIQAAIIRLTGRVFFHHVLYAATAGGLGTVLAWRIALRTLREGLRQSWIVSLLLAAPLAVLGVYSILPMPSYDCDTALSILIAVFLLQRLEPGSRIAALVAGTALCLPLFFKQNIGLPFLSVSLASVLALLVQSLLRGKQHSTQPSEVPAMLAILVGVAATLTAAVLLLSATVGFGNYIHWTVQFAAQRRLPGLSAMLDVYRQPSLAWMLPCVLAAVLLLLLTRTKSLWARWPALVLLAAPFAFTLYTLWLYDDADERGDSLLALWPLLLILAAALALFNLRRGLSLRALVPILILAAIHGTLLSQQLWGSTYAIWPLLMLLIANLLVALAGIEGAHSARQTITVTVSAVLSATFLICGGAYTASEERLSYADLPDEPAVRSTLPQLAGMATSGPYLAEFDQMIRFASDHIPQDDGLILLPGEDPFYFTTGRTPHFPVLLFDPATDPYSPAELLNQIRARNIRWLIVKHHLQIKEDPTPQREATMRLLLGEFKLDTQLKGYDVYRRP
jgi:branched-subunit amino acid transport protein AzlD